jgi:hypothetical protein
MAIASQPICPNTLTPLGMNNAVAFAIESSSQPTVAVSDSMMSDVFTKVHKHGNKTTGATPQMKVNGYIIQRVFVTGLKITYLVS